MSAPTDRPSGAPAERPVDVAADRPGGAAADRPLGAQDARPRPRGRPPYNVVLVGLSGSGKSTVARLLARRLGWRYVDTDREIQQRAGLTVQQIFAERGEAEFRALEALVVREVCAASRQVIATGGGAVVNERNRDEMLDGNLVVFLESSPEVLARRLAESVRREPRPLLANADLAARLTDLSRQREHHYRCAHHVVRTDHRTPREVADVIADLVHRR